MRLQEVAKARQFPLDEGVWLIFRLTRVWCEVSIAIFSS